MTRIQLCPSKIERATIIHTEPSSASDLIGESKKPKILYLCFHFAKKKTQKKPQSLHFYSTILGTSKLNKSRDKPKLDGIAIRFIFEKIKFILF